MLTFQTRQEPLAQGQVVLVISPSGSIDKNTCKQFERQLEDYLRVGYRFLIMNCSGLNFINSTGLQILVRMVEEFQGVGGVLLFINVSASITKFFDMLGFSPIFTSFTEQSEAVRFINNQINSGDQKPIQPIAPQGSATPQAPKSIPPSPRPTQKFSKPALGSSPLNSPSPPLNSPSSPLKPPTSSLKPPSSPLNSPSSFAGRPQQPTHSVSLNPRDNKPANITKSFTQATNTSGELLIRMKVDYKKSMKPFCAYPLEVNITQTENANNQEVFNVIPYFPGCISVPEYRLLGVQEGTNTAQFWITPLVKKNIDAWIEVWRGEESAQKVDVSIAIKTSFLTKCFVALSALAFFFPTLISEYELPSVLSQLEHWPHLNSVSMTAGTLALLCSILVHWSQRAKGNCREFQIGL